MRHTRFPALAVGALLAALAWAAPTACAADPAPPVQPAARDTAQQALAEWLEAFNSADATRL